jgi:hypothetical protein
MSPNTFAFLIVLLLSTASVAAHNKITTYPDGFAIEEHDDENPRCDGWARRGECEVNARFMLVHCKRACTMFFEISPPAPAPWLSEEEAIDLALTNATAILNATYKAKLSSLFAGTFTQACRDEVSAALVDHVQRFVTESLFPFQDTQFVSQCAEQTENVTAVYKAPSDIRLMYLIMVPAI